MELWHISKYDQERRNLIYSDFNRKQPYKCSLHNNPISTWTEISYSCMDLIMKLTNDAQKELEDQKQKSSLLNKRYHLIFGDKHKIIRKLYTLFIAPILKESIERRTTTICKDFYIVIYAIQCMFKFRSLFLYYLLISKILIINNNNIHSTYNIDHQVGKRR